MSQVASAGQFCERISQAAITRVLARRNRASVASVCNTSSVHKACRCFSDEKIRQDLLRRLGEGIESAKQKLRIQRKDALPTFSQTACSALSQRCRIFSSEKHRQAKCMQFLLPHDFGWRLEPLRIHDGSLVDDRAGIERRFGFQQEYLNLLFGYR